MKRDIYLKVILTIIAICLVWICIRDINIGPRELQAADSQVYKTQRVRVERIDNMALFSLRRAWIGHPVEVQVMNWPDHETTKKVNK